MTEQWGFYFDGERCIGCHACTQACRVRNDLDADDDVAWRNVVHVSEGTFPDYEERSVSMSCYHCADPPCRDVCPTHALEKRAEDGIVTVDRDVCIGCNYCSYACPYGAVQFGEEGLAQKCHGCLGAGPGDGNGTPQRSESETARQTPACVDNCVTGALDAGPIGEFLEEASEEAAAAYRQREDGAAVVTEPCGHERDRERSAGEDR